ncbi:arsenate reductase/protein-tyrosine-phosphatase family protein [Streptomyces albidoflavus]
MAGLLLGTGLAVLRQRLGTSLTTTAQLAAHTGVPVLGAVPVDADAAQRPTGENATGRSPWAESFRHLRTNLRFARIGERPGAVVVTSPLPGEGKTATATATALALSLAASGTSTCLVDADLRRPGVATRFGLVQDAGLTTALIGQAEPADLDQRAPGGLAVPAGGPLPPNPGSRTPRGGRGGRPHRRGGRAPVSAPRVLFVRAGNLYRSPLAERLLAARLPTARLPTARIGSAGTHARPGPRMDPETRRVLAERGGDDTGFTSRQLTPELVGGADLVLGTERAHRDAAVRLRPGALHRAFTLREFVRLATGTPPGAEDEIEDPHGAGEEMLRDCAERLDALAAEVARVLGGPGPTASPAGLTTPATWASC